MKKLVLLLLLSLPLTLNAESLSVGGSFRGLNNGDASIMIADNEAQDLLNVDITKNGYGIAKRAGYAQFKTIGTSTWGVRGGYYFTDQAGNNKIIHANDKSVFYSVNGGNYTAFYTTATAGSYWDFVDSQGILYGANHNHDPPFTYNGTALTFSTSVPAGSQVEAYPDRLVVAGSTANPNNIYFSRAANFSDFTVGDLGDDAPYFEYYGLPGQLVQAIKYAYGELLIWTKTSMGRYVGSNQYDGTLDDISSTIGSDQPSTVITDQGVTYFQATDRHFYAYDGQSITKISDAISRSVSQFVRGDSKSWATTTSDDFTAGTAGTGLSLTTSPGDVQFSFTVIDRFTDGDYDADPMWTRITPAGTAVVTDSALRLFASSACVYVGNVASTGSWAWDHQQNFGESSFFFKILSNVPSAVALNAVDVGYSFNIGLSSIQFYKGTTLISSGTFTAMSIGTNYGLQINRTAGGVFRFYIDNVLAFTGVDTTYANFPYISMSNDNNSSFPTYQVKVDDFAFYYGTATYQSINFNIGTAITSWGAVEINQVLNDGTMVYALYTDTNSAITVGDSRSWVSSQTITSGEIPTIATAAYLTWTAAFSRTAAAQTPALNDLTVNWFEGVTPRNWGFVDNDHRIGWSVAEGTATVPNKTYIYDPRFQSWLKYSVPFDAPTKVGTSIYFGAVSTGSVYQWPSGNTDNGAAILGYWKTKDFIAPDPYIEKDFTSFSLVAKAQSGSGIFVLCTVNTSTTITRTFNLADSNGGLFKRINFNLPSGKFGTFINFNIGSSAGNAPFEFYSFKYDYKPRPWRVLQ